jgi:recombinational DNA repair ATPase RecF
MDIGKFKYSWLGGLEKVVCSITFGDKKWYPCSEEQVLAAKSALEFFGRNPSAPSFLYVSNLDANVRSAHIYSITMHADENVFKFVNTIGKMSTVKFSITKDVVDLSKNIFKFSDFFHSFPITVFQADGEKKMVSSLDEFRRTFMRPMGIDVDTIIVANNTKWNVLHKGRNQLLNMLIVRNFESGGIPIFVIDAKTETFPKSVELISLFERTLLDAKITI